MHSSKEHFNNNLNGICSVRQFFRTRPLARDICHAQVFTLPCACVAMKRKKNVKSMWLAQRLLYFIFNWIHLGLLFDTVIFLKKNHMFI